MDKMLKMIGKLIIYAAPIVIMIFLIPFIQNDLLLTIVYVGIIILSLLPERDKKDLIFLAFGFVAMTISEYFFIKTGVETFSHRAYLGVMPLWLPFLWANAFVAMKKGILVLVKNYE